MSDFSQNIQNFRQYGTYIYKFDEVGNIIFNSSSTDFSQIYLAFPLKNIVYNDNKLDLFYDPEFKEFIPTEIQIERTVNINSSDLQQKLDMVQQENFSLQDQLNVIIAQMESGGSVADQMAISQVILELRKALGQGRIDSDFSETFPYTAIRKNKT